MEKIYISGRISGLPIEEVAAKFDETETKLKAQGYEVINPLKNGIPATALLGSPCSYGRSSTYGVRRYLFVARLGIFQRGYA